MILGTGIDIVELDRFEKVYLKYGNRLLDKIFTPNEIPKYKNKNKFISTLAGKFAAKEAASKAYGTGLGKFLNFRDISILNTRNGRPYIKIKTKNEKRLHVSISHSNRDAIAVVILED